MTLPFNLTYFLYFYTLWMVEAFLPIYFKSISIPDKSIGLLVGAFAASSSISIIPAGIVSDRISPYSIIRFGIILFLIYILGLIQSGLTLTILSFTIIGGIGSTLINIGLNTSFYRGLKEGGRGSRIGSFLFSSSAGYSLGPLSAGYLLHKADMKFVFIFGIVCISILFLFTFFLKEEYASPASEGDKLKLSDYMPILKRHETIFLLLSVSVIGIHLGAEQSSLSLFLKMNIKLQAQSIGTIYAWVGLWVGLIAYLSGRIFDRTKDILLFLWSGMIISGIFQIATAHTQWYWDVLTMRMLHTIGDSFLILSNGILISTIFKEKHMGGGVGIVQGFRMGSIFISATLSGFLNGIYGYHINFITTGILSLLSGIFMLLLRKKLKLSFNPLRYYKTR